MVANRVTLEDLDNSSLPTITKMLRDGSIGLISPNCIGAKNEAAVMLTASAGTPCRGAGAIGEFYGANERTTDGVRASDAFALRTGESVPADSVVFLGLGPVLRATADLNDSGSQLGALGDALFKAGKAVSVIGNADRLPDTKDRSAAVLAMDSRGVAGVGRLDEGAPGEAKLNDSLFSGVAGLRESAQTCLMRSDYVVVYYGDTVRLDEYKPGMSDEAYAARKLSVLRNLDGMLAYLAGSLKARGARIVLVSFSPSVDGPWSQLTPIIVYPAAKPSLLMSPATRTPGVIAASDFAPTLLDILGVPATHSMVGRPARGVSAPRRLEALRYIDDRVMINRRLLLPLAWFIVIVTAISFTGSALVVVLKLRAPRRVLGLLRAGLMLSACAPVALLLDVLAPANTVGYVVGTLVPIFVTAAVCLGLGALLAPKMRVRALPVVIAYAFASLVVLVDSLAGGNLCKFAGASSFQISGMRFYGIGNEYAGMLISAAALAVVFIAGRQRSSRLQKWFAAAFGVFTIFVLGAGNLGANYGATAAAGVAAALIGMAFWKGGFRGRHVVAAFALGIICVVAFAVIDWRIAGGAGTHAGRLTGMFETVGPGYVVAIALRKVLMNLAITVSPLAQRIIFTFVPFLILWQARLWPKVKDMLRDESGMVAGLKGLGIGAIAAYLLNDSGLVFACLMVGMMVLILIYSLLEERQVADERAGSREEAAVCRES